MQRNVNLIVFYCFFVIFTPSSSLFGGFYRWKNLFYDEKILPIRGKKHTHFIKLIESYYLISSKIYSHNSAWKKIFSKWRFKSVLKCLFTLFLILYFILLPLIARLFSNPYLHSENPRKFKTVRMEWEDGAWRDLNLALSQTSFKGRISYLVFPSVSPPRQGEQYSLPGCWGPHEKKVIRNVFT